MDASKLPSPGRDSLRFAPVFVLSPARSNSSVIVTMLGQHPELESFPELALFRADRVDRLLGDPPAWRGTPAKHKVGGLLRTLAQQHEGEQTPQSVNRARAWLERRSGWESAAIYDHVLKGATPRIGVEKSPETSARDTSLARVAAAYPRARFLHLVRHPIATARSMHRAWNAADTWNVEPALFGQFCLAVWLHQHRRIAAFGDGLAKDRFLRVRAEDVLSAPAEALPDLCRWLVIADGAEAIAPMLHPERSPFARVGPGGARGGQDPGFLSAPQLRSQTPPRDFSLPDDWIVDPWTHLAVIELATRFGYTESAPIHLPEGREAIKDGRADRIQRTHVMLT